MDAILEHVRREVPWNMLYSDDLIVDDKEEAGIQAHFSDWQWALESKGLKINFKKTETMVCAKTHETLMIRDRTGQLLEQTETFKYLGSVINAKGSCELEELAGVLCDAKNTKIS